MSGLLRSALVDLSFRSIRAGIRLPRPGQLESFYQWSQLIDLLRRLDVNVFIDVGAHRGKYAAQLRGGGYASMIISFEPMPAAYERVEQLASGDQSWLVRNCALGDVAEQREFHVNTFDGDQTSMSSFLEIKKPLDECRPITVQIERLDAILPPMIASIRSPRIFLKMDTQGFDKRVFAGATGCLEAIVGLQSELSVIPLYDGMPHFTETIECYEAAGFQLLDLFAINRTDDGRVVEYDCLMAKIDSRSR
jgi:FkbM family methyltransferase